MKKTNKTELIFLLDRSGSMSGLESDTIGGFNSMLERQKEQEGEVRVTTVLFDDRYELLHDRVPLSQVPPLTREQYYVRGCTALLDAMGKTIRRIAQARRVTPEAERPDKVLFVITTDGLENASRRFRARDVRTMVERTREKFGWEYLFLGANIDAIAAAAEVGISAERAVDFHPDAQGMETCFASLSRAVSHCRAECPAPLSADWKADIEADFRSRRSRR